MTKTKPQITEYNCETGIETIRDATDAEIAQIEIDVAAALAAEAETEAKEAAKAEILSRIGLTVDELKTILG